MDDTTPQAKDTDVAKRYEERVVEIRVGDIISINGVKIVVVSFSLFQNIEEIRVIIEALDAQSASQMQGNAAKNQEMTESVMQFVQSILRGKFPGGM